MNASSDTGRRQRLRERLRSATRAAILQAAEDVFLETGKDSARMESIAARAGIAVGTLYNYFEDREGLLVALVDARRAALLQRLDATLAEGRGLSFEDAFAGLLRALFDHWAEHHGLLAVLLRAEEEGVVAPGRGLLLDDVTRRVEKVLRRGRAQGKLRADGAGFQATAVVGMVRGILRRDARRKGGARAGVRASQVAEMFLRGARR